jgi:thiamine monophosphate synthase
MNREVCVTLAGRKLWFSADVAGRIAQQGRSVLLGTEMRHCDTPAEFAQALGRKRLAPYVVVGRTLYTPCPAAFAGVWNHGLVWAAERGGWNAIADISAYRCEAGQHNLALVVGVSDRFYLLPEGHPAHGAEWFNPEKI